MSERRILVRGMSKRYRKGTKKEKGAILDEFVEVTGYQRKYAARLLRSQGKKVWVTPTTAVVGDSRVRSTRQRRKTYGLAVQQALVRMWKMLDYLCSKRLVAALPATLEALQRHKEWKAGAEVTEKLLAVSPATIDRILAPQRKKLQLKGRSLTKPGTLLRHQVPVRTFSEWDEDRPGFSEIDLVAHEGGNASGDFAQTLDLTDVATGWTELAAVQNKAQVWVFAAIKDVRKRLPFPLLGLDSDNGGEFINHHLVRYCKQQKITFTRSRPYRKNDNCFVEQKNYSVVRRFVGYGRFDTTEDVALLNELYGHVRLYVNFFLPSLKLKEKIRQGSRVLKRYDPAQTPYQRVLDSEYIAVSNKQKLKAQYLKLNPAQLHRTIQRLQSKLLDLGAKKQRALPVDSAVTDGKASGFPTATRKTPKEFPAPPTETTT